MDIFIKNPASVTIIVAAITITAVIVIQNYDELARDIISIADIITLKHTTLFDAARFNFEITFLACEACLEPKIIDQTFIPDNILMSTFNYCYKSGNQRYSSDEYPYSVQRISEERISADKVIMKVYFRTNWGRDAQIEQPYFRLGS